MSDNPQEALERLNTIHPDSLSESNRHYFDFLTIKAKDKAYIYHTSDSLILDVIAYASSHKNEGYYPEALYYGGRVYSDLGDSPNALRYFQEALDHLPADTKDLNLKCRILSQTGRLFNILRLHKDATHYISAALDIEKQQRDTISIIDDLQLLGHTYLRAEVYDSAQLYLKESLCLGNNLPQANTLLSKMYLAQVKYKIGELDSATLLIRGIPEQADSVILNSALGYAANIYLKAGKLDSAYMYANQLIYSTDPAHKEIGYQVILAPELRSFLTIDSIGTYLAHYRGILNNYYDANTSQLAINQKSLYNYQLHKREREKAEKRGVKFKNWLICALAAIILLLYSILSLKIRTKNKIIQLQQALNSINKLKIQTGTIQELPLTSSKAPTEDKLREEIRHKLLSLTEECKDIIPTDPKILQSEPYAQLQEVISQEKMLREKDALWDELEKVVTESSPGFKKKLTLLTSGKLSLAEFQLALLIRCGIRPSQMTVLLGKTNGAIISRRDIMAKKIFDHKLSAKDINNMIRLL